MVSTAEYLENSASPAQAPAPHQYRHRAAVAAARAAGKARRRSARSPAGRPAGPRCLLVTPKTGDRFSVTAAQKPARGPPIAAPRRAINHVVSANSRMNGRRATTGASEPNRWVAAQESHQDGGGMVEIAEAQDAAGGDHVAFVNAEAGGGGEGEAERGGDQDQQDHLASHADSLPCFDAPFLGVRAAV